MTEPEHRQTPVLTPAESAAAGGVPSFDFMRYLHTVWKRKWTVILTVALVTGMAALWVFTRVKIYQSTTTILIERQAPQVLGSEVREVVDTSMGNYFRNKEYMETQVEVITSKSLAEKVAQQLNLAERTAFWGPASELAKLSKSDAPKRTLDDAAKHLRTLVSAKAARDANLLEVYAEHPDPDLAAELANAVARAYLDRTIEYRLSSTSGAVKWLADQLDDLKQQLEKAELALHDFKKDNNIVSVSLEDKQTLISRQIEKVSDALTEIKLKRMALEAQRKQALKMAGLDPLDVPMEQVLQDTTIRSLREKLHTEQMTYEGIREHYGEKLREYREQKAKVDSLRAGLEHEVKSVLAKVENTYKELQDNEKQLAAALQAAKDEALDLNKREVTYQRLKRNQENTAKLYTMVLTRMKESDLSSQLKVSNARILDDAVPALIPVRPRVLLSLLASLFVGFFLGVGLAFLVDALDSSVKSQEDVSMVPGLVFLGLMPRIPGSETSRRGRRPEPKPDLDLVVHRSPKSSVAESCRAIRTNIMFTSADQSVKTIIVTSPGPREGKTTTAVSLAITMAQAGGKILLVDTDMRRPRLHRIFGISGKEGITSLLLRNSKLEDMVKPTEVPNLELLPCGHVPPNPAELCQSPRFRELLKELASRYDRVIFDSPPTMVVTDAAILSTITDGVLLVARTGFTNRGGLRDTARQLQDVGARIFGCVLNDMDLNKRGYGYYRYRRYGYYRYGYGRYGYGQYGDDEKEAASS